MLNAAYMEYKNCVTMPISEKAEYVPSWDWWCRRVFTAAQENDAGEFPAQELPGWATE